MTVEERVARLEQRADDRDAVLIRMESKLDTLLAAFNMGRGGAIALAKLGGIVILLATALAWLWANVFSPLLTGKH